MSRDTYRPTTHEIAWGWLPGLVDPPAHRQATARPVGALAHVIARTAGERQVFVAFSGGRDSSAVLAAATHAAHLAGTRAPIPVTFVYPGVPETDESAWQRSVVDHLGLQEWWRLPITVEHDLLGPVAQASLRRHGLLWPATLHTHEPLLERCAGGAILTGEGGDEVFGDRRLRPVRRTARHPLAAGSPRRAALAAVSPARSRRRHLRMTIAMPWLRPAVYDDLVERVCTDDVAEPLAFGASLRWVARRRSVTEFRRNYSALAAEHEATVSHPLLDPEFLDALARHHPTGFSSRTEGMRAVFAGALPDALLARTSKATFTHAFLGEATREFARRWDGSGVPHDLVDADALRRAWLSARVPGPTSLLLQSAWLAGQACLPAEEAA
ncbi:asparagine synthase-related protein [Isoptericola sp. AK164]|uniref:asparagine synthase-related protein n=1 Tax=Isoptericola sp. AK164 TaxID=3024246 RepID=UPI00241834D4|nr:asparagine synthase-related protein [Isoptericola sp. AK164]